MTDACKKQINRQCHLNLVVEIPNLNETGKKILAKHESFSSLQKKCEKEIDIIQESLDTHWGPV